MFSYLLPDSPVALLFEHRIRLTGWLTAQQRVLSFVESSLNLSSSNSCGSLAESICSWDP